MFWELGYPLLHLTLSCHHLLESTNNGFQQLADSKLLTEAMSVVLSAFPT